MGDPPQLGCAPSSRAAGGVASPDSDEPPPWSTGGKKPAPVGWVPAMAVDLVIDIDNNPGALAEVAAAISDAGVNISAATCIGPGERAELHILVPHAEAVRHQLAITNVAVTREREVVVVDVEDRPGELADIARRVAKEGINLDLVYVATQNRVVLGSPDIDKLRLAVGKH